MSNELDRLDRSATPEEEAAARRLAEVLDGGVDDNRDEAVAATRMLQALGISERGDELAARRLRNELVRAAGRGKRVRRERMLAAASIVLAAAATTLLLARHRPVHSLAELDAQEAKARSAVAQLLVQGSEEARLATLTESLREARLDKLLSSRLDSVLGGTSSGTDGAAARPSPTPGGPVS